MLFLFAILFFPAKKLARGIFPPKL